MKEDYGELHPKILDLGMRLINESYQSSNQRCIAMLLALKSFVNVRNKN
jgi:translation initiation factor 2B subunit (eIF-2B alpha/beta/delta family)